MGFHYVLQEKSEFSPASAYLTPASSARPPFHAKHPPPEPLILLGPSFPRSQAAFAQAPPSPSFT